MCRLKWILCAEIVLGNLACALSAEWEPHTVLDAGTTEVSLLRFSPDGQLLVSASQEKWGHSSEPVVRLWRVAGWTDHAKLERMRSIGPIEFSPDGKLLAVGTGPSLRITQVSAFGAVHLWNTSDGKLVRTVRSWDFGGVNSLSFSPDGKTLAAGLSGGSDIVLLDPKTGERTRSLKHHDPGSIGAVWGLVYANDGKTLISRYLNINLWDTETYLIRSIDPAGSFTMDVSPDRELFAFGRGADGVEILSTEAGQRVGHVPARTSSRMRFSGDGKLLATWVYALGVEIWDIATSKVHLDLRGNTRKLRSLAFSGDGRFLATGQEDGSVKLWNLSNGAIESQSRQDVGWISSLAFTPDSNQLVAGTQKGTLFVWNVKRRSE